MGESTLIVTVIGMNVHYKYWASHNEMTSKTINQNMFFLCHSVPLCDCQAREGSSCSKKLYFMWLLMYFFLLVIDSFIICWEKFKFKNIYIFLKKFKNINLNTYYRTWLRILCVFPIILTSTSPMTIIIAFGLILCGLYWGSCLHFETSWAFLIFNADTIMICTSLIWISSRWTPFFPLVVVYFLYEEFSSVTYHAYLMFTC